MIDYANKHAQRDYGMTSTDIRIEDLKNEIKKATNLLCITIMLVVVCFFVSMI